MRWPSSKSASIAMMLVGWCSCLVAAPPSTEELARKSQWIAENFAAVSTEAAAAEETAPGRKSGLLVLANHDAVLRNGRPDGRPIKIGDTEFRKGLLCHAVSKIVVGLPGPGSQFRAVVGVDANAGGGTVRFAVKIGDRELFQSGVLKGGQAGLAVSVDLGGAEEFCIEADDAGDGISCDHAAWADARVTLVDGREIELADLPLLNPDLPPRRRSIPPFSFLYGGVSSDELLGRWEYTLTIEWVDDQRSRSRMVHVYKDPSTGLVVQCVLIEYHDYPTVEWTLTFQNSGSADTPIISDIQTLDTRIRSAADGRFLLHHNVGSPAAANDFAPLETALAPGDSRRISAAGGRPTNSDLSYFNLEQDGGGMILAVGWPGQWAAQFERELRGDLRICAGQERTHFKLHPRESVRTPLIVLQFWRGGDWIRAQNVWRRWMVAHNLPRPGGRLVPTHYGGCFGNPLPHADEEIEQIDGAVRAGIKLDYWFIDAGWYPCGGSWVNVGTWETDPARFPRGLREVADHAHARDIKFVVWFEPERVAAGSWLAEQHPEWVLGGRQGGLLNLGQPAAWQWAVEHFDGLISAQGVDVYRQDFNIDPLAFWRANDAEDRQGITEIQHVTGYLAYWDELLRRHPDLLIDTCASGGRRNDLETLRRAVPLLRSDWAVVAFNSAGAIGQQCQTYGLSLWSPYHGTGAPLSDAYTMRSSFAPAYRLGWDARNEKTDWELLRRTVQEFRRLEKYLLGDFYPLTPYSLENTAWMAWQFDRPELGEGVVQAFRREESGQSSLSFRLRGLEADGCYALTDLDSSAVQEASGRELAENGLVVTAETRPSARVILYRKRGRTR